MYICVCKAITEANLKSQIEDGASSLEQVQRRCGAASACGSCRFKVERLLRETRRDAVDAEPIEIRRVVE